MDTQNATIQNGQIVIPVPATSTTRAPSDVATEMVGYQGQKTQNSNDITGAQKAIDDLNTQIATWQTTITNLTAANVDLDTKIAADLALLDLYAQSLNFADWATYQASLQSNQMTP